MSKCKILIPLFAVSCLAVLFGGGCCNCEFEGVADAPPSAEYVRKYAEYVKLLQMNLETIQEEYKAGNRAEEDYIQAQECCGLGRLALARLEAGRSAEPTFVDTLIREEMAQRMLAKANRDFKNGTVPPSDVLECRLSLAEIELDLIDELDGVEPGVVQAAVEIIKEQADGGLTDGQIAKLVELER